MMIPRPHPSSRTRRARRPAASRTGALVLALAFALPVVPLHGQDPDAVDVAEDTQLSLGPDLIYAVGADLSFLKAVEDGGTVFTDDGVPKPGLEIFRDHGYDWIRLRLFHTPSRHEDDLPNDLEYTIALAQEAKAHGFRFLLDYHYSDSWADPQKQWAPQSWEGLELDEVADSVFEYTRSTIEAFRTAGVMPDMVQLGNELRNGMIWPYGRLPENWDGFATLFRAGLDGVDAGRGQAPRPLIMLHYDNGADTPGTKEFYDRFHGYDIPYDIIGLSYYPWWHGTLLELRDNFLSILENYPDRDVILVEAGWRPWEYRNSGNPPPFPLDAPEGSHRLFLEEVNDLLLGLNSRRVKGIFWWEPAWGCDSDFFDAECETRDVIHVFDKWRRR